mgnify:CR=1 FL=1
MKKSNIYPEDFMNTDERIQEVVMSDLLIHKKVAKKQNKASFTDL